jgi:hypothetical protein
MQSSKRSITLYAFTQPYIDILNEHIRETFGVPVAGKHQGALYALTITETIPDAAFLYLVNNRRLLGDECITVSNAGEKEVKKLHELTLKCRAKDKILVASAIVVATALAVQKHSQTA